MRYGIHLGFLVSSDLIYLYDSNISQWDIRKDVNLYNTKVVSTSIYELNITWSCDLHNCDIDENVNISNKLTARQCTFNRNVTINPAWTFEDLANTIVWTITNFWWTHINKWESYDPTISWLMAKDRKAAIDELASMIWWGSGWNVLWNLWLVDWINFIWTTDKGDGKKVSVIIGWKWSWNCLWKQLGNA